MSTEKSCQTCFWFMVTSVWPGDYCSSPAIKHCKDFSFYTPALTPAQKHAEELLEALKNLLNAEQCPNCNNVGSYQISDSDIEQCEWCDTVENSIFNRKNQAIQIIARAGTK